MKIILYAIAATILLCFESVSQGATIIPPPNNKDPYVIADKKNGTIAVVYPSGEQIVSPALYGALKSDILYYNAPRKITPSGRYKIIKRYSTYLNSSVIVFVEDKDVALAIHPVWMGIPSQNRLHRIYSETPEDNRITNGCINVLSDFFYGVLNTLPDDTTLHILPE